MNVAAGEAAPMNRPYLSFALTVALGGLGVSAYAAEQPARHAGQKLDSYGDPLPTGALLRLGTTRLRQPGGCYCVALSPDGKRVASGGVYSVRVWDAATGVKLREFPH